MCYRWLWRYKERGASKGLYLDIGQVPIGQGLYPGLKHAQHATGHQLIMPIPLPYLLLHLGTQ